MDQTKQTNTDVSQSVEELHHVIGAALGIPETPNDKQKELIDKTVETILKKLYLDTIERLSEEDQKTYLQFIESEKPPEEVARFLNEKIPDYPGMTQKIIKDFIEGLKTAISS
jgi:hypothetical protein